MQNPTARGSLADRPGVANRPPATRSRVTNGSELLPNVDGRGLLARRYKDICAALSSDQGGADRLTEARTQLIRRFSAAACMAEAMEAKLINGQTIDLQQHATLCSTLVRLVQRIGIDRRLRNVVPDIADYLEAEDADSS